MDKNGVVTFEKWNTGQVKHPIYGFGLLQNVEVFENRGIAKLKNRALERTTINVDQLPIAEVKDQYGNVYTLTGSTGQGSFYKNGVALQTAMPNPWDLAIYKDYVWVRQSNKLHAYGPLSGATQWFDSIDTSMSQVYNGKLLVGQDDFLYTGNANFVSKIEVLTSGTVGVAPTITFTGSALDLPDGQYVTTLVEYGKNIMVGTQGGSSYADRGNYPNARIYPWNRQAGTLGNPGLADLPIVFSENGINAMIQHANKLYVQAGTQGNVYVTDSTNFAFIGVLPYAPSGVISNSTVFANGMSVSAQGTLLIGLCTFGDQQGRGGIYEVDLKDASYPISYRTISTKNQGLTAVTKIGFIRQSDYQTLNVGWSQGSDYGIDSSDFVLFSSYAGIIETDLRKVGGYNSKKTFEHLEWCLAEPLVAGQNIRISYRLNNKADYTLIGTWGFTAVGDTIKGLGSVISFEDIGAIADAEYVQLKIELDQSESTVYGSNINLIAVRLW
jgi:hypothetical protein